MQCAFTCKCVHVIVYDKTCRNVKNETMVVLCINMCYCSVEDLEKALQTKSLAIVIVLKDCLAILK
jgi:hypothetical protein